MRTSLTFVSSFFHVYDAGIDIHSCAKGVPELKTIEWRIQRFLEIANTGVKICLYVCPRIEPHIHPYIDDLSNVHLVVFEGGLQTTFVSECLHQFQHTYGLPIDRDNDKDTEAYMTLMNSKIQFVADAIERNPFHSTHFAWMDFNLSHVFKNDTDSTLRYIAWLGAQTQFKNTCLVFPGCWNRDVMEQQMHTIVEKIQWRFCGGFFLGDAQSIMQFYYLIQKAFPRFMEEYHTLVWEVNIWAWMEHVYQGADTDVEEWKPTWYYADHDDNIVCALPHDIVFEDGIGKPK